MSFLLSTSIQPPIFLKNFMDRNKHKDTDRKKVLKSEGIKVEGVVNGRVCAWVSKEKISRNSKLRGTNVPLHLKWPSIHTTRSQIAAAKEQKKIFPGRCWFAASWKNWWTLENEKESIKNRNMCPVVECGKYRSENDRNLKLIMILLGNNNHREKGSSRIIWLIIEKGIFWWSDG